MFEVLKEILISKLKVTGDQAAPEGQSREDVEPPTAAHRSFELSGCSWRRGYGIEISARRADGRLTHRDR
ncbi:hypothetical protein [Streptomyces hypolithicus]